MMDEKQWLLLIILSGGTLKLMFKEEKKSTYLFVSTEVDIL
jgi:hypothetical protein